MGGSPDFRTADPPIPDDAIKFTGADAPTTPYMAPT
jgi:hypothetical protein